MKVLLPIADCSKAGKSVVQNADNCDYACVYDSEQNTYKYISMYSISRKTGNLCVELKRQGISHMICRSIPNLAIELFSAMGVNIYQANGINVYENVKRFNSGELASFTQKWAIQAACNGSDCNSCSSAC